MGVRDFMEVLWGNLFKSIEAYTCTFDALNVDDFGEILYLHIQMFSHLIFRITNIVKSHE